MEGKKRAEQVVAQISQRLGNLGDVRAVSTRLGRGIRKPSAFSAGKAFDKERESLRE